MDYYTALMTLTISIVLVLLTIIISNNHFDRRIRKGFIITFILLTIGASCEWIGNSIDGKRFCNWYNIDIIFHRVIKFMELSILPVLPIICSKTIFEIKETSSKINELLLKITIVSMTLEEVLMIGGEVFLVDEKNIYYHAELYNIYIITFILSTIYMISSALKFSKYSQNNKRLEINSILAFIILGVFIQIFNPETKTCWLTVAVSGMYMYIYYNGLIQSIDKLTGLLNQSCYNTYLENNENKKFALIIFDANNFKFINDNLGHDFGDRVLSAIARIIKEQYAPYGKCYRIGGDEFAVILEKNIDKIEEINKKFIEKLEIEKMSVPELPHVSYGVSIYDPNSVYTVGDTKNKADSEMYTYKKKYKEKQKNK